MHSIDSNVIKNFPGVAVRFDPASRKVSYLEGAGKSQIFGELCQLKNLLVDDLRKLIIEADKEKIIAQSNLHLEAGENWNFEYQIIRDDKTLWVCEQSYNTYDAENKALVVGLFITEITDSKTQRQKLLDELNQAGKLAILKNEFFAGMSHEIRTPMNAVMGMAQILAKTSLDVEQKQYVNTIIGSSNALVQIINDILDLSKLDAGKVELTEEEVDLEYLCLEVCHLLAARADEKKLPLFLNYKATECKKVLVDKGRLRQILINLIGNAVKFTEVGHVELLIEYNQQFNKPIIKFSIKDTGIGISDEAKESLFNAYAQADKSIAQRYGGTGLGLQISQRLVNILGGDIGVDSRIGEGSEFWFTLPLEVIESVDTIKIRNKNCLLVDSDSYSTTIHSEFLRNYGLNVEAVSNVEEAGLLIKNHSKIDYIVINNNSGKLDGSRLKDLIKKETQHNIPMILLTNIAKRENSATLFDAGINAYLPKPVSPSLLKEALRSVDSVDPGVNKAIYISTENLSSEKNSDKISIRAQGKALIAEDVEINQVILKSMLGHIGLEADIVNNGREALDKVSAVDYDIIFMDCRMPIMDGFEATKKIRDLGADKVGLPIVALTANASDDDRRNCIAAGMSDFLSKPYVEKDLAEIIKKWIAVDFVEVTNNISNDTDVFENKILDHIQFDSIKESLGDEFSSFALDITDKFLNYQQDIINALKIGDMITVYEKGHSLKGIAAMIGAKQVSEIAYSLELAGIEEDFESALEMAIVSLTELDAAISKTHSMIIINLNPEIDKSLFLF